MRFQYDAEPTLRETVFQAMGFASVCWTNVENAGEFQPDLCGKAGNEALVAIRSIITFELSRMLDSTSTAKEWNAAIEAAMDKVDLL